MAAAIRVSAVRGGGGRAAALWPAQLLFPGLPKLSRSPGRRSSVFGCPEKFLWFAGPRGADNLMEIRCVTYFDRPTLALRALLEKSSDTDPLRDLVGFTARA